MWSGLCTPPLVLRETVPGVHPFAANFGMQNWLGNPRTVCQTCLCNPFAYFEFARNVSWWPLIDALTSAPSHPHQAGIVLAVHGEVTGPSVDFFDREAVFIERVLKPLLDKVSRNFVWWKCG